MVVDCYFFFFKQKTAYDVRISDWSSDVCSSDLIIKQAVDLAGKLGVTPKDNAVTQSLLKGEKETFAKLEKLKGNAFDKAYIDNEVAYHTAVIEAVKKLLVPQTQNAQLKELLISAGTLLDHNLEMAKMAQK